MRPSNYTLCYAHLVKAAHQLELSNSKLRKHTSELEITKQLLEPSIHTTLAFLGLNSKHISYDFNTLTLGPLGMHTRCLYKCFVGLCVTFLQLRCVPALLLMPCKVPSRHIATTCHVAAKKPMAPPQHKKTSAVTKTRDGCCRAGQCSVHM